MRRGTVRLGFSLVTLLFASYVMAPAVSAAGGYTWQDVSQLAGNSGIANKNWWDVIASSTGQYLVAMISSGDIWISSNYGASWTDNSQLSGNAAMSGLSWQGGTISSTGQYITLTAGFGDIWTSGNYGQTWTDDSQLSGNSGTSNQSCTTVNISPDGQTIVAASCPGDIWRSINGGVTWTDTATLPGNSGMGGGQCWNSYASTNVQVIAAALYGGGIWNSYDGGVTWTDGAASSGSRNWWAAALSGTGQFIVGVVNPGDVYIGNDPAYAPAPVVSASSVTSSPTDPDTGFGQPATSSSAVGYILTVSALSAGVGFMLRYKRNRRLFQNRVRQREYSPCFRGTPIHSPAEQAVAGGQPAPRPQRP